MYLFISVCVERGERDGGAAADDGTRDGKLFRFFSFPSWWCAPSLISTPSFFLAGEGAEAIRDGSQKEERQSLFCLSVCVCVLVPFLLIWSSSAFSFFSFSLPLCTWVGGWVGAARLLLSLATDNPSCSVVDVGNRRSSLRARKRVGTLVVVVVVVCNHATFLSFPFFFIHPPSGRRGGGDGEPVAPVGWNQSIIVNESSRNESFKGKREEKEARWMDGYYGRCLCCCSRYIYTSIRQKEGNRFWW